MIAPGLPSGHPGSHPASARLAAWTVAMQANGDIDVTINRLKDPAGLQATLRADGLPVNVTFSGAEPSASCQPYAASGDELSAVARWNTSDGSAFPAGRWSSRHRPGPPAARWLPAWSTPASSAPGSRAGSV